MSNGSGLRTVRLARHEPSLNVALRSHAATGGWSTPRRFIMWYGLWTARVRLSVTGGLPGSWTVTVMWNTVYWRFGARGRAQTWADRPRAGARDPALGRPPE